MKLTDKCKEDFNKWIIKQKKENYNQFYYNFYDLTPSMQYGVYVDFFDSVGIDVQMETGDFGGYNLIIHDGKKYHSFEGISGERQEAREQAIIKANEIYNT